jgi:uncharacterized protein YcfL
MKRNLLFVLAMVLLVACGGSDSTTGPATATGPDGINTTPRTETGGAWPDGPSVSAISWRLVDLGFYGALRVSYNITLTNNDPSRAISISYYFTFFDANGFQIGGNEFSYVSSVTIPPASSRSLSGTLNVARVETVDLANQISEMRVGATFTF